ncbi:hypothetical protein [Streptomyces pseudovenezuelae]|uniref:hypothetical protein n=1 Tax=Streptomyces pseudovenezuelae TaxID=67350 RepID=UPI0024737684|nr:hypothetical protein [Streptomyces pseudovenezuelae]
MHVCLHDDGVEGLVDAAPPSTSSTPPATRSAAPTPAPTNTDLPPGDYDVYVLQYRLPAGTTSQQYTLWSSEVGLGAPAVRPSVTPPSQQVTAATAPN